MRLSSPELDPVVKERDQRTAMESIQHAPNEQAWSEVSRTVDLADLAAIAPPLAAPAEGWIPWSPARLIIETPTWRMDVDEDADEDDDDDDYDDEEYDDDDDDDDEEDDDEDDDEDELE